MRYQSTRNHSISVTPQEAVLHGLAEDGGLFVPSEPLPLLKSEDYLNKSYQDTAQNVLSILLDGYSKDELHRSITSAYDTRFNSTDIVPLTKVSDGWLMELWHGPTSAFKDIALTILPHLLSEAYGEKGRDDTIAILTATSGDTGKAALSGFADVPHTAITVFYPSDGVSEIQKLQMQTSRGNNVMVEACKQWYDPGRRSGELRRSDRQLRRYPGRVSCKADGPSSQETHLCQQLQPCADGFSEYRHVFCPTSISSYDVSFDGHSDFQQPGTPALF